jgi:hypothetical protein
MAIEGMWWDARLYAGAYDLSGNTNAIKLDVSRKVLAYGLMGSIWENKVLGPATATLKASGLMNTAQGAVDDNLWAQFGLADYPITFMSNNTPIEGSECRFFRAANGLYQMGGSYGDNLAYTMNAVSGQGAYPVVRGFVLEPGTTTRNAGGNGTGLNVMGAVSATQYLYGALHVVAISGGGTLTVSIQSDIIGWPSPVSRITFTAATTVTYQFATRVAGPITDTYWRALWTLTAGTARFAVVAGVI